VLQRAVRHRAAQLLAQRDRGQAQHRGALVRHLWTARMHAHQQLLLTTNNQQ
jgi:hypothetical protein